MEKTTFGERVSGAIFGSAYGDALGRPTEFDRHPTMAAVADLPTPAVVTDDTMMMLATGRALRNMRRGLPWWNEPRRAARALRREYIAWSKLPQAGRAPGGTCMQAIHTLNQFPHQPWQACTVLRSKGCGANMRVQPVAFLKGYSDDERAGLAQLSAAMTHGHPTALAATDLTVKALHLLAGGHPLDVTLVEILEDYAHSQRTIYRQAWLGNLVDQVQGTRAHTRHRAWIRTGWDDVLRQLNRLQHAVYTWDGAKDPCLLTGEGWTADSALMTSLLVAICYESTPVLALQRAALTCGDSDSLACITGALVGAAHGSSAWPREWADRIEFAPELRSLVHQLTHQ